MFENLSDRIAGTLLMGLDVAVEFATLGELRLVDPALAPASIPPSTAAVATLPARHPRFRIDEVDFTLLPKPSTALARAHAAPVAVAASVLSTRAVVRPADASCSRPRRARPSAPESARRTTPRTRA